MDRASGYDQKVGVRVPPGSLKSKSLARFLIVRLFYALYMWGKNNDHKRSVVV